jgi:hypothetical protein
MRDDSVTSPVHARFKRSVDPLVHIVAGNPKASVWGTMACGALFQWTPGTERRADPTDEAPTCIMCIGYVGRHDW